MHQLTTTLIKVEDAYTSFSKIIRILQSGKIE